MAVRGPSRRRLPQEESPDPMASPAGLHVKGFEEGLAALAEVAEREAGNGMVRVLRDQEQCVALVENPLHVAAVLADVKERVHHLAADQRPVRVLPAVAAARR